MVAFARQQLGAGTNFPPKKTEKNTPKITNGLEKGWQGRLPGKQHCVFLHNWKFFVDIFEVSEFNSIPFSFYWGWVKEAWSSTRWETCIEAGGLAPGPRSRSSCRGCWRCRRSCGRTMSSATSSGPSPALPAVAGLRGRRGQGGRVGLFFLELQACRRAVDSSSLTPPEFLPGNKSATIRIFCTIQFFRGSVGNVLLFCFFFPGTDEFQE